MPKWTFVQHPPLYAKCTFVQQPPFYAKRDLRPTIAFEWFRVNEYRAMCLKRLNNMVH